jgi:hypothetical protein
MRNSISLIPRKLLAPMSRQSRGSDLRQAQIVTGPRVAATAVHFPGSVLDP